MAEEMGNNGKNKRGAPTAEKHKEIQKKCEAAFSKGYSILYAARILNLSKNTVWSYYKDLREKMQDTMDEDFIEEQKTSRQMAMMDLDVEIQAIDDMINDEEYGLMRKIVDDPENSAWTSQLKSAIELRSNFKQQKHALGMTPTIDVSIDDIVSEMREEVDDKE